jgi:iron complex outermembrane receptor protein
MRKFFLSFILLLPAVWLCAQSQISGTVNDETSQPVPGATVQIVRLSKLVTTNENGQFTLEVSSSGVYKVKVSAIGYPSQEKAVEVKGGSAEVAFQLDPNIGSLEITESAIVEATQADERTPMAYTNVSEEEIEKLNIGQDLPYLVRYTPSVVTTSDAGAGIGYSGLRIRGSDQTRINVTVNGIPINDSESQGVFWVNMPDLASSVDNLQIQRGVGTSTNGAGAFGATIKMNTTDFGPAHAEVRSGMGSFNTFRNTASFGTGLINDHWVMEGRLSKITSDGYIDRATSDLQSYYLSGGYVGENTSLKAVIFGGDERTYQSWYGTPESRVDGDLEAMQAYADRNFLSEAERANLLNSGRNYNYYTYENEVDNYSQDHYQLHFDHRFSDNLKLNVSGHYTRGEGYFEQYRNKDDFEEYGLSNIQLANDQVFSNDTTEGGGFINTDFQNMIGQEDADISFDVMTDQAGDTITDGSGNVLLDANAAINSTDLVRRRWLDNHFYGGVFSLTYTQSNLEVILGGGANQYIGDHFGEFIWVEHSDNVEIGDYYYFNDATKNDANLYLKATYNVTDKLIVFGDVQGRFVDYRTQGIDSDQRPIDVQDENFFFNPKAGLTYRIDNTDRVYGSFSVANREPVRNDYIDAPQEEFPEHETLYDLELGYERVGEWYNASVSIYNMQYQNQLVLTGAVNDVGSGIRENVKSSYRRGVELIAGAKAFENLHVQLNATFSQNKIEQYNEIIPDYLVIDHGESNIAFSPEIIAGGQVTYTAFDNDLHTLSLTWLAKYVGEQYLDNTSNPDRAIDPYLVNNAQLVYTVKNKLFKELTLTARVNNVLNENYVSNGYTFSYYYQELITENFYYPQATRNFMFGLTAKF